MNSEVPEKVYDLLRKAVNGNIEDYSVSVHGSNEKGQGFYGEISYISIEEINSGNVTHFVIKKAFAEDNLRDIHPIRQYYLNEIRFYTKLWANFQKLQTETSLSEPFDKIPKCYITSSEEKQEKLILENLKYQNFQTYDKTKPFNKEHINFILKEYGKFHAISFAYKLLKPEEYNEISKDLKDFSVGTGKQQGFRDFFTHIFEISLKSLDPQKDAKAIEKFKPCVETGFDNFTEKSFYNGGDFSVVLHGDCWSNNMMFKYDESNKLCDMRFFDFQLSKVGTPVSDLSYFLYSGGSKDIFDHLDHYLKVYHNSLLITLQEFGLDSANIYPFEALKKDWREYCTTGFSLGLMLWRTKLVYYKDSTMESTAIEDSDSDVVKDTKYDVQTFNCRVRELILHMVENDFL